MNPPVVYTHDLCFSFGQLRVLNDINLAVPEGSIYGFLGPNGAGKTTTIKVLLGLLQVDRGKAFLFNHDIQHQPMLVLAKTGAMVETASIYQHLTGKENVDIVRILRNLPRNKTREVLQIMDLWDQAKRPAGQYSTGMKQRLAMAIALLGQPELLLLDEPMNGLDPSGIVEIREFLRKINKEYGTTILLSSHILGEIEKLATHLGIIDKGNLKFQGTLDELYNRIQVSFTVRISTNNAAEAGNVLSNLFSPVTVEEKTVLFRIRDEKEIALAVNLLVEKGISVFQVKTQHSDLEGLYLNILKE